MNSRILNNILLISCLTAFILLYTKDDLKAQMLDLGQNPPGMKWRQIDTKGFQIIYPATFEREAQRMANTLQKIIPEVSQSLHKVPRKISVILQNQGVISNGFVTLAPRRTEFVTTPYQSFDSQDWLNNLAVHELRHIVQFEKFGGALIKVPILESYTGLILDLQVPSWFWEGDAVGIETALTKAGRGRLPSFELPFRTNTLSGHKYSYSKNYLGSIKDISAGYYPLGYFMTTKLRRDYGAVILEKIANDVRKNPLRPYALSRSIKRYTGLNTHQLHDAVLVELDSLWSRQSRRLDGVNYQRLNNRVDSVATDYLMPVILPNNELLVLKKSRKRTAMFVTIDSSGFERKVIDIGTQVLENFNYRSGKLVWDEIRVNTRYHEQTFSVINCYDLKKKRYHQVTHKTRLFAPALSADGETIVAVGVSYDNDVFLFEFDQDGHEIKKYDNPLNWALQTPQFNAEGTKITCVAVSKDGTSLLEIDRITGKMNQVIPFARQQITRPSYAGSKILFKAHYNGIDNIYSVNPENKRIIQLTSAKYGAFNPSYDVARQRILFNSYQAHGQDVAAIPYNEGAGIDLNKLENTFINYAQPIVKQEGDIDVFNTIPNKKYASKYYGQHKHLFYFYNVEPVLQRNGQTQQNNIGFNVFSRNKFNTLDLKLGYQYNQGLGTNEYLVEATYKGLYPIIKGSIVGRSQLAYTTDAGGNSVPFNWREQEANFGASIPFVWYLRNWRNSFEFGLSSSCTWRYNLSTSVPDFSHALRFPVTYRFNWARLANLSAMDLAPRWGHNISFVHRSFPFGNRLNGNIWSIQSTFYTPGLMANHSFNFSFNYQKTTGDYRYTVDIPTVSGYNNLVPTGTLVNTLLLNYAFPILYPDWEIGPVAYVKRLRGALFCDFEDVGQTRLFMPRTFGLELTADLNLLRYVPLFSVGGKVIFVNHEVGASPIFQLLLSLNY